MVCPVVIASTGVGQRKEVANLSGLHVRSDNLPRTTPSCSLCSRKRAKSKPETNFGEPGEGGQRHRAAKQEERRRILEDQRQEEKRRRREEEGRFADEQRRRAAGEAVAPAEAQAMDFFFSVRGRRPWFAL